MAVFRYNGPWDTREVWGVVFRQGETLDVSDAALINKLKALSGFELVGEDAPASNPDPDDYPAAPEPVAFDDLKIPVVGAGTIPENWREMHHSSRMKLARQLSGMDDITNDAAAVAVIEALLEAR